MILTAIGRISILKTLGLSQLVYLFQALPNPSLKALLLFLWFFYPLSFHILFIATLFNLLLLPLMY